MPQQPGRSCRVVGSHRDRAVVLTPAPIGERYAIVATPPAPPRQHSPNICLIEICEGAAVAVESIQSTRSEWPIRIRARKPPIGAGIRTIRIGLLGLGNVGQAVARLTADRGSAERAGVRFRIE